MKAEPLNRDPLLWEEAFDGNLSELDTSTDYLTKKPSVRNSEAFTGYEKGGHAHQ